ncbi:MAG: hypothetical protein JWO63_1892 [Frankiales bacterium]|nr:hypothetical protein [Frankiales bacterium]
MTGSAEWSRRYLSAAALKLHLTLLLAGGGCLAAGWFEWTRALDGHEVAWVYAFEWPFFALAGSVLWWRLLPASRAPCSREPGATNRQIAAGTESATDTGLIAWQDYLARLHITDPPGGPPRRR